MRSGLALAAVAAAALAVVGAARADDDDGAERFTASLAARAVALDKTDALLGEMLLARRAELADRVRALYKTSRHVPLRLWVDPAERIAAVRRQGAAIRILRRDLAELALIEGEAVSAAAARGQLALDHPAAAVSLPRAGSLHRPVAGGRIVGRFGDYERGGVKLARRGVEVSARPGKNVRAVDAGQVRFVGELRGLGTVIVTAHGGYMSVLGRVANVKVAAGHPVARGDAIAEAEGDRVYVEIRALAGRGGFPVDPAPLID